MGLKSDFEEVARDWRKTPWRMKFWLILSLFLSSGSIASLSETVAKWKGFIFDAVTFYRGSISEPIQAFLAQVLPFSLPKGTSDALIVITLLASASTRLYLHTGAPRLARTFAIYTVAGAFTGAAIVVATKGKFTRLNEFASALALVALGVSAFYWSMGGAARILWFVYLLSPFAVVGLLAAVNSGLGR